MFAVEQVDVIKGSSSALGGGGSTGGSINLVTKVAYQGDALEGTVSGGTDNHSMLVDLRAKYPELTGKVAEKALVSADITVNKNMVPFDSRSAFQTSGIRLGTPAITTRGAKEDLMAEIAEMIETVLSNVENEAVIAEVRARVNKTMEKYPLFAY